jgi:hypothetical protein
VTHATLLEDTEGVPWETSSTILEDREAVSSVPSSGIREHMDADFWVQRSTHLQDRNSVS